MDGSVCIESGRLSAVRFFLPQPAVSFERAADLLFHPDTDFDEQDGLLMCSELARLGRLSEAERERLRVGLRRAPCCFLKIHREWCWGAHNPPQDHFWWFAPQDWPASGVAHGA